MTGSDSRSGHSRLVLYRQREAAHIRDSPCIVQTKGGSTHQRLRLKGGLCNGASAVHVELRMARPSGTAAPKCAVSYASLRGGAQHHLPGTNTRVCCGSRPMRWPFTVINAVLLTSPALLLVWPCSASASAAGHGAEAPDAERACCWVAGRACTVASRHQSAA